jgi:hypothetical protein
LLTLWANRLLYAARKGERMKHKVLGVLAIVTVLGGVLTLPSVSHASPITIVDVNVFVDAGGGTGNNFCGLAGCPNGPGGAIIDNVIWNFTPAVVLQTTESLLLSQTGGTYNFDVSDFCLGATSCLAAVITVVTAEFGNIVLGEGSQRNLTCPAGCGGDTINDPPLETREYQNVAAGPPLELLVGYTDNAHLQSAHPACAATATSNDGVPAGTSTNCFPDPFSATFAQQASATGGCLGGTDPCYDAGVLRLTNTTRTQVPEPSALFLLGAGLLGLAAWGRRHIRS